MAIHPALWLQVAMDIQYYHVDVFSGSPFKGNPAGVCLLDFWLDDVLLQNIATENNLPETAFIVPDGEYFALRWFTPTIEMDLCGHATLGAAFVLNLTNDITRWPVHFATQSGVLSVTKENDFYFLDLPSRPASTCPTPDNLIKGLGKKSRELYKSRDYLAIFDNEEQVADLAPDFTLLEGLDCLGIIVTAPGEDVDFVSRFFAPAAGIPEDPVTGSSHCTLIPYWSKRTGKKHLFTRQISSRGGELTCENKDDLVRIGGQVALYHSGTILLKD